jgi:hypothetical protein
MRIKIERQGGLAGRPAAGERKESELTAAEHQAVKQLLLSPPPSNPSPGADRFHYKITVEDETGTRELEVPEHAMPEILAGIPKIRL